jgi:hypothetical protein
MMIDMKPIVSIQEYSLEMFLLINVIFCKKIVHPFDFYHMISIL